MIGLGWYTNFSIYKRETKDIEQRVRSSLQENLREIAKTLIDSEISSFRRTLSKLEYERIKMEAVGWEAKGVVANAIRCWAELVPLAWPYADLQIAKIMDKLRELIKLQPDCLDSSLSADIREAFAAVPAKYLSEATSVLKMIDDALEKK